MRNEEKKEREEKHPGPDACASPDIDPAIVSFIVHRYITKLIRPLERKTEVSAGGNGSGTTGCE